MTDLLGIISASDKRRNLLILLNSGPKSWEEVKTALEVTSTGMLPQIKILEEEHLITRSGKNYALTPMGKAIVAHTVPFIKTVEVFDTHKKFWEEHDLSVLPEEILLNIHTLGNYRILENPDEDIFEVTPFLNNMAMAKKLKGISHTVHPKFP
jgi:predicted transcriptional regulator